MLGTFWQNSRLGIFLTGCFYLRIWLRGQDLNLRPSGYEPDELPGCSTPRQTKKPPLGMPAAAFEIVNGFSCLTLASKPGDDLLFHCLGSSTIGAVRFHGRVRDGIGWVTDAMATKLWGQRKTGVSRNRALGIGIWRHLAENQTSSPICRPKAVRTVDDGGTLKREMSN